MWATDFLSTGRMQRGYCHGLLALVMAAAWAGNVAAQADATYIKASNPGVDDQFGGSGVLLGVSVALSGDGTTLAAGARLEDSAATGIDGDQQDNSGRNAGAAYVFGRAQNGSWQQEAYLKASNAGPGDQFGFAVALSDDGATLAVSANLEDSAATGINGDQDDNSMENSGAVYIFRRGAEGWRQEAYVKASNTGEPEDGDNFGYVLSLSADGDTLAVGATGEDSASVGVNGYPSDNSARGAGAVYVFVREDGNWSQQAYLKASNTDATDLFGISLAISDDGNTLVVSALDEDGSSSGVDGPDDNGARGSGAVYVFTRQGAQWQQQSYLKASNAARNDAFSMVALSGDGNTIGVAAFDEDSSDIGVARIRRTIPPRTPARCTSFRETTRTGLRRLTSSHPIPAPSINSGLACSSIAMAAFWRWERRWKTAAPAA